MSDNTGDALTGDDLAELRRLCEAASPASWGWMAECALLMDGDDEPVFRNTGDRSHDPTEADAAFIAASRSAVPRLLDLVPRLRAERDAAAAELYEAKRLCHEYVRQCRDALAGTAKAREERDRWFALKVNAESQRDAALARVAELEGKANG
jgi:hypothetical protein